MGTDYKLRSCVWEITLACCFSCRHCGSRAGKARENELSTAECLEVARQLAEMGCRRVSMIGGEVFMRPDWAEIAGALTSQGVRVCIITNGFVFSDRLLAAIKAIGLESVAVSLDGDRETHDRIRQEGSFDRALAAVGKLRAAGIPVSVITTISGGNVHCLESMYETLKDKGIFAWQLQACSPMGNAAGSCAEGDAAGGPGEEAGADGFDHRFDFGRVIRFVEDRADAPFAVGIADNIGYFSPGEGSLRGNRSGEAVFRGCKAGLSSVGIDSVGNVRGCESMYDERFNEGNLRERTLREIWEDPKAFAYNRDFTPELLTGFCSECEQGPYCAGGCRSYNYFAGSGRLYESPYCYRKTHSGNE